MKDCFFWKEGFSNLDPIIGLHFFYKFPSSYQQNVFSLQENIFERERERKKKEEKCKSQVSVKKWSKLHEI